MALQFFEKSTTSATLSNLSKTNPVRTKKVNLSKCSIPFASILLSVVLRMVVVESDDSEERVDCSAVLLVVANS